jgi:YesN/AraC family two-component response regulator
VFAEVEEVGAMARILIIDDEDLVRFTLRAMLEGEAHEVLEAENGEQGIPILEETQVDVVISDILMPVREGLETITEVKSRWPEIPVIAIFGGGRFGNTNYLEMAAQMGATTTLRKPFTRDDLLAKLDMCLRSGGDNGAN